jgi:hypothetical protein
MDPGKRLRPAAPAAVLAAALAAAGCHRASRAECEQIVDRIVELELRDQGITDPGALEARKADARAKRQDSLVRDCVGKRISASAMACIRAAKTSAEITDKCLH